MITNEDVTKLKGVFATKEDLNQGLSDLRVEFGEVDDKIDTVAATVARIENTLDKVAGAIQDLRTENGAGAAHLARHDRQIAALATHTGATVPD